MITFCWQKKSWASSITAKSTQAVFLCLVHNLMVCYEATLAKTGLCNTAEEERRQKVLTSRTAKVEKPGANCPSSFPASSASPSAPSNSSDGCDVFSGRPTPSTISCAS